MAGLLLGWVMGIVVLQSAPRLYAPLWLFVPGMAVLGWIALFYALRVRLMSPVLGFLLLFILGMSIGATYADLRAQARLSEQLAEQLDGSESTLSGTIVSLVERLSHGCRFTVVPDEPRPDGVPSRIAVTWFGIDPVAETRSLHPGQHWVWHWRLRRPHALINPGAFDAETWAWSEGILAQAVVSKSQPPVPLQPVILSPGLRLEVQVSRLRERVRQRIERVLPQARWVSVIVALVLGDQSGISDPDWKLFWSTGVGHLISISGLHITMLAGLVARLFGMFYPSLRLRWLAGLVGAGGYAVLAGLSIPTQRTLDMMGSAVLARLLRRPPHFGLVLLWSLALTLLIDPWGVLTASFWLSFGAVAIMAYAGGFGIARRSWLHETLHSQWAATWAMVPLLVLLFGQVPLISPLANAWAIPVVSLGVVPLALVGVLPECGVFLKAAHELFSWVAQGLLWLSQFSWAVLVLPQPSGLGFVLGLLGVLSLLAPRGLPGRPAGWIGILALALTAPLRPDPGTIRMTVIDVGQGLAVLVMTRHHTLMVDTGPRTGSMSDAGARVVLPLLSAWGVARLDGLVLSHRDSDHSGGLAAIVERYPPLWVLTSLAADDPLLRPVPAAMACRTGQHWRWDGVDFVILHPASDPEALSRIRPNERSCVLRMAVSGHRILLPGDIGRSTERLLLNRDPGGLGADVLLVPHHGSKTSSSVPFITAVHPLWAVFSVGHRNRYHHPDPGVTERYRAQGSWIVRTDRCGALSFDVGPAGIAFDAERLRFPHYWSPTCHFEGGPLRPGESLSKSHLPIGR